MNFLNKYKRLILFIAAIINFIGSMPALISPSFFFSQFFKHAPDPTTTFPYVAMYHYLFWGIGLIMGIAYWMAAVDPVKNKVVLFIGGLGKLLAVAFWLMLFIQGQGKWLMLSGAISDGILGILMLYWFFGKETEQK
ncbi:hypothetical protein BH09BAC5_BH09BAC5_24320 [soil metagenome]